MGIDRPVKKDDHAVDRDRYGLFSHYGSGSVDFDLTGGGITKTSDSCGTLFTPY